MRSLKDLNKLVKRRWEYRSLGRMDRLRYTHGLLSAGSGFEQLNIDDFDPEVVETDDLLKKREKIITL